MSGGLSRVRSVAAASALLAMQVTAQAQDGVWKALVPPPGAIQGEFQDNDPIGLAAGAEIKADCSLYWTDPKEHKTYCFASGTSLETFLDAPQTYIAEARKTWAKLHPAGEGR
jgi:YHS domain-containing protein